MPDSPEISRLSFRNDLAGVPAAVEWIERCCKERSVSLMVTQALNLAVEELIINSISYGYPEGTEGRLELSFERRPSEVVVIARDDGRPFDITDVPEPDTHAPLEERTPGGLGLLFVRHLMDRVEYRREAGQNVVTLVKQLSA